MGGGRRRKAVRAVDIRGCGAVAAGEAGLLATTGGAKALARGSVLEDRGGIPAVCSCKKAA